MHETGLVIEVPQADGLVAGLRDMYDPVASLGMPAHITVLYPFVPPRIFDQSILHRLTSVAASIKPSEYSLTSLDQFPGAIWLRPEPDRFFRSLTNLVVGEFPDYLPYGGQFPDTQPHLTVALQQDSALQTKLADQIEQEIGEQLPVVCRPTSLSVFMSDAEGQWTRAHSIPLG